MNEKKNKLWKTNKNTQWNTNLYWWWLWKPQIYQNYYVYFFFPSLSFSFFLSLSLYLNACVLLDAVTNYIEIFCSTANFIHNDHFHSQFRHKTYQIWRNVSDSSREKGKKQHTTTGKSNCDCMWWTFICRILFGCFDKETTQNITIIWA